MAEISMSASKTVFVTTEVEVTIHDPEVVERVTGPNGDEWRSQMYPTMRTREAVIGHFARNYVINGIDDIRRLDGWADASEGAVSFISVSESVRDWEGDEL